MTRITECLLCAGSYIHGTTQSPHSEGEIIPFISQRRSPKGSKVFPQDQRLSVTVLGFETKRGQLCTQATGAWPLESALNGLPFTSAKSSLMRPLRALLRKAPGRPITEEY